MYKEEYRDKLNQSFQGLSQKILDIRVYKNNAQESYKKDLDFINKQIKEVDLDIDEYKGFSGFHYQDIVKNSKENIGFKEQTWKDFLESTKFHHNKQYQWFLVEAYEVYEKYIEELYAIVGYHDNNFWNASDFGDISIDNIKNNSFSWFQDRVLKKKETPFSIIKHFRKKLLLMEDYELGKDIIINGINTNQYIKREKLNYKFYMALISEFRNCIVHDRGYIKDKDEFLKKVLGNIGINGRKNEEEYLQHIEPFFGTGRYANLICVTELITGKTTYSVSYQDRLNIFLEDIVSYSKLICDLIIMSIDE